MLDLFDDGVADMPNLKNILARKFSPVPLFSVTRRRRRRNTNANYPKKEVHPM